MGFTPFTLALGKLIYPLPPPPETRTKPFRVLCLGLPRSGTDSLHTALLTLGYSDVSHGFPWWLQHPHHSVTYCELGVLRATNRLPSSPTRLREDYLDRVLGHCEATTDVPGAWFAAELLTAYPDAKVVLNRRRDVAAWKASFRASVLPMMTTWGYWAASWFDAELFWGMGLTLWMHGEVLFKGDFEGEAERAYVRHYEELERRLEREGRKFLKWGVEDGWEPLCEFLDQPVPDGKFPAGNVAAEFGPKLMVADERRFANARKNACIFFSTIVALVGFGVWAAKS